MSVVFDKKAGEIGGDGWNLIDTEERSKNGGRPRALGKNAHLCAMQYFLL